MGSAFASGHHKVVHLDLDSGLRQGTVDKVFQDNRGFVWVLNENGVDIYDGYRFRPLNGPDNYFADSFAVDVTQDTNGNIWLAFLEKGLLFYDPIKNNYQQIDISDNGQQAQLVAIAASNNNQLVVLTTNSLFSVDIDTKKVTPLTAFEQYIQDDRAMYSLVVSEHMVFIGSRKGLFFFDLSTSTLHQLPDILGNSPEHASHGEQANKIFSVAFHNNTLYLGTFRGVYSANVAHLLNASEEDNNVHYHRIDAAASVWKLHVENDVLYVADERGLFTYDIKAKDYKLFAAANTLSDEVSDGRIINVFSDHQDRLWLSTSSRGILVVHRENKAIKNTYSVNNKINGLPNSDVWSIAQSTKYPNDIWIATSFGVARKNLKTGTYQHYFQDLTNNFQYDENYIFDLDFITPDDLLVVSGRKSYVLNMSSGFRTELIPGTELGDLINSDYYILTFIEEGFAWLATLENLYLVDFKKLEVVQTYNFASQGIKNTLQGVLQRLDEHHFLLSSGQALYVFNKLNGNIKKVFDNPYAQGNEWLPFLKSYLDDAGQLWLSVTSNGIVVLDSNSYDVISIINNDTHGIDNNVYGLIPDDDGNIWFSSHDGVYAINASTKVLRHFDDFDGLVGNEFNLGAALRLKNGDIAFGSTAGLSIIAPKLVKENAVNRGAFPIQISNFDILSSDIVFPLYADNQSTINLSYDDIGIRLSFTDFDYMNIGEQKFLYELSGPEPVTFPPTNDNFIVFPRLASGSHTLKVQSISPDTGSPSAPYFLKLHVSYAPWKSPIAYLIYSVVILSALSIFIYRRRMSQLALLEAHEEVKYRENRLQLALKGSNSDVWDWQAAEDLLFSKRINQELGYKYAESAYQLSQHIDLIHPEDKGEFISTWQKFLQRADLNENFSCTYRLKSESGHWFWFKDLGKIVALDINGKPSRVTGSYTNITETRAEEERAQYYGVAFAQTKDWVVIINHNLTKITANKAIRDVFGWHAEDLPIETFAKTLPRAKRHFYIELIRRLTAGESWRGDELITLENGKEYHVLINITVGESQHDKQQHYVCLITDITAQKNAEQELRYMANYDHLTGLPNRTLLLDRIEHAMTMVQRDKSEMALLFIDLDRFKQVNDSLGHDYGDMLLKVVTERLKNALRTEDTIARLGGDEFVVLIENYDKTEDVARIAQGVIESLAQPVTLIEHIVTIGASIGIAIYPENAEDSAELLRSADIAMYHAKQNGRNHFQFFTEQMNAQVAERVRQEASLKLAVQESKFVNHYQPIIDTETGKTVGVEILLRWPTPEGLIPPVEFIPMAEELGLIGEMTWKSLKVALKDLRRWRAHNKSMYLSLNVSATHFHNQSLILYVNDLLTKFDLPPEALKIEVTESALIKEPEKATQTMLELNKLGVELALDDFGTGYSSLAYLKQLPLNIIKVDRSFISGIGCEETDQAIVDATLVLASSLNMRCVAEGVETQAQLDYLRKKGCRYIQGYLFSKPVPAIEIDSRVVSENFVATT